jgi:hypothetical protein
MEVTAVQNEESGRVQVLSHSVVAARVTCGGPKLSTTSMADTSRPTTPKNQPRDSQRGDLESSPMKQTAPQVDIDKRDKWSMYVYPKVHKEIEFAPMLLKLCPKYEEINKLASKVPEMKRTEPKSSKSTYCDYLNRLSTSVQGNESGMSHTPYICGFGSLQLQLPTPSNSNLRVITPCSITQLEPSVAQISWP